MSVGPGRSSLPRLPHCLVPVHALHDCRTHAFAKS
jgi:hypothetical protein